MTLDHYDPVSPAAIHIPGHIVIPFPQQPQRYRVVTRLRIRWFVCFLYFAAIVLTAVTFTAQPATARVTAGLDMLALMLLIAWVRPSKEGA